VATSGFANAPSVVFAGDKAPDFGKRYPLQGCDWVAEVREDESPRGREFHANAHLIAAAPEMLKALYAAIHALRSYQYGNSATDLARECADHCDEVYRKATRGNGS
jgi:hypothetical protein